MDVDTLVATLLSLGFDYDRCQQAISEGNSSVEAAVEWLLKREKCEPKPADKTDDSDVEPPQPSSSNAEEKSDKQVVSRYTTDENQKKAQEEFEKRQRDINEREAKKRRLVEKQVRQEILQQIKEDRDIANSRRAKGNTKTVVGTDETTAASNSSLIAGPSSDITEKACKLKIRLSSGKNIVEHCESNEILLDIISRIKRAYRENESDNVDIIQPFPPKKFTSEDLQQSLVELDLARGGCLVLKKITSAGSGLNVSSYGNSSEPNRLSQPPRAFPNVDDEDEQGGNEPPEIIEENEYDREGDDEAGFPAPPDYDVLPARRQHQWGAGLSLGRHPYNPHAIDPVIHAESPAEAAEARSRVKTDQYAAQAEKGPVSLPCQDVVSLVDICINDIATRLPGHHHPVGSLAPLSQRLCSKILKYLMKKQTLTPKTLNYFVACQLQQLVLDHYLYVTNELFHTIRLFKSLTHLSVQSCTVFNDKALEAIAGLKKIIHLDFSNCTQLTNKCLKHLQTLKNLEALKLDNTKVTDEGLCQLFKVSEWNKLHILSLSKTSCSNKSLEALRARYLKELHLEQTRVSELQAVAELTALTRLNIAGTKINDQSLLGLRNHPSLNKLNLHQTQITDQGLAHLTGLELLELRLPNRLDITDAGISNMRGLPLTSLDLTDYINITDEALRTIGQMTRLIRLSLSKTKISDDGMQLLRGLVNLKEMDLQRTAVGDQGLDVLSFWVRLEELNLAGTMVSDSGLLAGKLNCLRSLCKLNLRRTNVSDRGIANLKLPHLILLNLDWTLTTEECRNLLVDCPNLQALRRQNCRT